MATESASIARLGYAAPAVQVPVTRFDAGSASRIGETLAEETPVSIAYNLAPYAVMMATPDDLDDFAVGFSLTEGIVSRADEIGRVEVVRHGRGIELQIEVPAHVAATAGTRSRRLSGRTGCGICGTDDVDRVLRDLPAVGHGTPIEAAAVTRAMQTLAARQPLNDATGAVHAAGWAHRDGSLVHVREDVGRHNALDKLIGCLIRAGEPPANGFVVMTSRGSFELVQKAAVLGVPLLATVSAPTALAVRVATEVGLTLVGFVRGARLTAYTHEARLSG